MPDRPELPTFFAYGGTVYNVLPDNRPMTWCIWDLEGCIGEMTLHQGTWTSHVDESDDILGPFPTWQQAVGGMLASRAPEAA